MPFTDISERYDVLMDAPVRTTSGDYVSSMTLADRAFQHEWFGKHLNKQPPRFGHRFPEGSPVTEYLGRDANTNGHMYELVYHVAQFLRNNPHINLSDEDRGLLMFVSGTHDTDESTHDQIRHTCGSVTGDIPCGLKSKRDKALQAKIRNMRDVHLYSDLPSSTLERAEAIVSHTDETLLGLIYDFVHELQALETTSIARQVLVNKDFHSRDEAGLREVAFDVEQNLQKRISPYVARFALIDITLAYPEIMSA